MKLIEKYLKKKYCKACNDNFKNILINLKEENIKIKRESNNVENITKILSLHQQIISIQKLNNINYIVAVNQFTNAQNILKDIDFFVIKLQDNSLKPVMTMHTEIQYNEYSKNSIEGIKIIDIVGIPNNGYGSFIMESFLKYIRVYRPQYIYGTLSNVDEVDENNKNRRNHFYKKFGFEIEGQNIYLRLNK